MSRTCNRRRYSGVANCWQRATNHWPRFSSSYTRLQSGSPRGVRQAFDCMYASARTHELISLSAHHPPRSSHVPRVRRAHHSRGVDTILSFLYNNPYPLSPHVDPHEETSEWRHVRCATKQPLSRAVEAMLELSRLCMYAVELTDFRGEAMSQLVAGPGAGWARGSR